MLLSFTVFPEFVPYRQKQGSFEESFQKRRNKWICVGRKQGKYCSWNICKWCRSDYPWLWSRQAPPVERLLERKSFERTFIKERKGTHSSHRLDYECFSNSAIISLIWCYWWCCASHISLRRGTESWGNNNLAASRSDIWGYWLQGYWRGSKTSFALRTVLRTSAHPLEKSTHAGAFSSFAQLVYEIARRTTAFCSFLKRNMYFTKPSNVEDEISVEE